MLAAIAHNLGRLAKLVTRPLLLLPGTGSVTREETVAVFVTTVPFGTPQPTFIVIVRVACAPLARETKKALNTPR